MVHPIWKDYFVDLGQHEYMDYSILARDIGNIFTGRAYRRPGESNILIKINDICQDYLENIIPNFSEQAFNFLSFPVEFSVEIRPTDTPPSVIDSVQFTNDWSYDDSYDASVHGMAFPINRRIAERQWIVWTGLNVSEVEMTIHFNNGEATEVTIPVEVSGDFNADFNSDFARAVMQAGSGTAVFNLAQWSDVRSIAINGVEYDVVSCGRYVLYYVNEYGGWDSLLIEGNTTESDSITRSMRDVVYDNRNVQNRGRVNYKNDIVKRRTLNTSWMSDDESLRMRHLLNATDVYLYDMQTEEMTPVILVNSTTDYKTYKSNGCKLVNYVIEVENANRYQRR